MTLTIPSPQNIKRREAFLFAHPDYYPENKLQSELLKISFIRRNKNLRWNKPINRLPQVEEKSTEFVPIEKKTSLIDKVKNIFTKG